MLKRCNLIPALLLLAVLLSSCPGGQGDNPNGSSTRLPDATGNSAAGTRPSVGKTGETERAEPGVDLVAEAQPGASPDEPPNPRPQTPDWVWTERLTHQVGDELAVEYQLASPGAGRAWIALVPVNITAKDAASNAKQAAQQYYPEAGDGKLSIPLDQAGRFTLRLFSNPDDTGHLLAESRVLTVEQAPLSELDSPQPPYVTLNSANSAKIEVQQDFPVIAYFEIPADCPTSIWLGVVPVGVESRLVSDNMKANVSYAHIDGKSKGEYTWVASIPGTYVFRIFPAEGTCFAMAESEPFTVNPKVVK